MAGGRSAAGAGAARKRRGRGGKASLLVLSTAPDRATAEKIGRALVGERLAACVNVVPGLRSIYRWKGKIERDREVLCLIKTRRTLLPALTRRLTALHPYDVPEVVAIGIVGGSRTYLDWIAEQTT